MIKEIPEDVIQFYPPHYDLEGSEVLEIIKDMPEKIILPINRKPSSMEVIYAERHPERKVPQLEEEAIKVLYYAVQEMYKIFEVISKNRKKHNKKKPSEENHSISKYNVLLSIHTDYDIAEVSFCPKISNWLDGPGDELGVNFYFTLSSYKLLKKTYMR